MNIRTISSRFALCALAVAALLTACNKKKDEPEQAYTPASNVALSGFALRPYPEIAQNLDSVYFAIDLNRAEVFNADSLPVGTVISNLVPVLTYPSTVAAVSIQAKNGTFDYIASPGTGMDMSDGLKITLTAKDGTTSRTYNVKINVHKQNPASFLWNQEQVATLPGGREAIDQKTLRFRDEVLCFTHNLGAGIHLSRTCSENRTWTTTTLSLTFEPNLRTLVAAEERLYVLSINGELFESSDGVTWNSTSQKWKNITGCYLGSVTGLAEKNGVLTHTSWPLGQLPEYPAEQDFPVNGFSNPGMVTSEWSPWPTLILCGGVTDGEELSAATWGFDGERWSVISTNHAPALFGATLIPYWMACPTTSHWLTADRDAWLLVGGLDKNNSVNRKIWYSLDNGVNWNEGAEGMTLPENCDMFVDTDAIVDLEPRSASALDWMQSRRKMNARVEGTEILWECPVIYFFGGRNPMINNPFVSTEIRRGALAKFTFIPIV